MSTPLIVNVPENLLHHCLELAYEMTEAERESAEFGEPVRQWNVSDAVTFILDHHFHGCPCGGEDVQVAQQPERQEDDSNLN